MSNRSLIEINHDYSHEWATGLIDLLQELARSGPAMRDDGIERLRLMGVTYLTTRHHSDPIRLPSDMASKQ